jgi:hypothetical protein
VAAAAGLPVQVPRAVAADPDVTGVDDARIGGAQSGRVSIESYTYDPVGGKPVPVVLTGGRMPATPDEIVLAPVTADELHAVIGSTVRLKPRIVKGQPGLAGQLGQHAVVLAGEGVRPGGPLHHDEAEQFARVTDRHDPQLALIAPVQQGRQPDRDPSAPRYPGPRHDRALTVSQHDRLAPASGTDTTRFSTSPAPA